jgi:hypothetical protein
MLVMIGCRKVTRIVGGVVIETGGVALGVPEEVHPDDPIDGLVFGVEELIEPQP